MSLEKSSAQRFEKDYSIVVKSKALGAKLSWAQILFCDLEQVTNLHKFHFLIYEFWIYSSIQ